MTDDFIPVEQTLLGAYAALEYAQTFFTQSEELFKQKKFQASIPLATISMEESLKGTELSINFRHSEPVTKENWEKLKEHKHKLTHVKNFAIEKIESSTEEEEQKAKEELRKGGIDMGEITGKEVAAHTKKLNFLHSHFQKLREMCFYSDWNKSEGTWNVFSGISEDRQEALAFFVLEEAERSLDFLKLSLEKIVNNLRQNGALLNLDLPYPPYKEYRPMNEFESVKKWKADSPSKYELILYQKGIEVLQKIISIQSLESVDYGILSDTMDKYFKIITKQKDDGRNLHPLMKAIMMALYSAKDKEGRYAAVATDAESSDGTFFIGFFVGVEAKDGYYTLVEISDFQNKNHKYTMEVIEKILRTEIIIERHEGNSIPISTYIEALSVIGLKSKMMKEDELAVAIEFAKEDIKNKKYEKIPKKWVDEISSMKGVEDWDKISTFARMMINNVYGLSKYPGYNIYITPSPAIEKWKTRTSILNAIQGRFLPVA